jgi:hypothetical protein
VGENSYSALFIFILYIFLKSWKNKGNKVEGEKINLNLNKKKILPVSGWKQLDPSHKNGKEH